jgi:pantetheine-phosphate adenylyltransferase
MSARADNGVLTAICPGSYDPVTLGHVDVVRRAAGIFDRVVVGVVRDPHHKQTLFTVEERVRFLEEALADVPNALVDVFSELVVDFARKHQAKTMVKGLRVIADFEWEFQMNRLNHLLAPEIETMYVMSSPQYAFISSSGVKEIASFGGRVDELVPPAVAARFRELYPDGRPGAPLSPQE